MFSRWLWIAAALAAGGGARAATLSFEFSQYGAGECPTNFVSAVTGPGSPADWKIAFEEIPPLIAPLSPQAEHTAARAALRVNSDDVRADHDALLLFTNDTYRDFTLTTRFRIDAGFVDPCAGVVFRAQDASNYYVVRASAEGNLLWHKVVGGRSYENLGIGVLTPVPKGQWQELKVDCRGSSIRCFLNGKLMLPPARAGEPTDGLSINDTTFSGGEIGFWIKADTSASFADAQLEYTPRVPYMQRVAEEVGGIYPKLLRLAIYAGTNDPPVVVGCPDAKELGTPGSKLEADTINKGMIFFAQDKDKEWVQVTMPLRDRNGDIAAAMETRMRRFPGETQDTALSRAMAVKKAIEDRLATLQNIME